MLVSFRKRAAKNQGYSAEHDLRHPMHLRHPVVGAENI